jgi:ABC-type multidrug transport system ATPase subunit/ABC-type multidrug transport system permease subunit
MSEVSVQSQVTVQSDDQKSSSTLPDVTIRYLNLNAVIKQTESQVDRTMKTVPQFIYENLKAIPNALLGTKLPTTDLKVLDNVSGCIKPGTLTLVLAPPGAGKTTLLKAMANRTDGLAFKIDGKVTYNGLDKTAVDARHCNLGQLVQYVDQLDLHLPYLTVEETLLFAARNSLAEADEAAVMKRVNETIDLLHLGNCRKTVVGDDLLRGISGGEKKRLTVAEGIITNARFLALDEISTGLDAAVTYSIVNALRQRALEYKTGVVIALLQPTPEVFDLFDDVILMREGSVVYHGNKNSLRDYMSSLGFIPPPADDSEDFADWVTEVLSFPEKTHKRNQHERGGLIVSTNKTEPPYTTQGLTASWHANPLRKINLSGGDECAANPDLPLTSTFALQQYGRPHVHHWAVHFYLVLMRQFLLMKRNPVYLTFRIFSSVFMAVIFGGLFWDNDQNNVSAGVSKFGLFLMTVMQIAFGNIAEMASACTDKFIAYRHSAYGYHPSWIYPFTALFSQLPIAIIESFIFGGISYFMGGLTYEAGRFLFFILVLILSNLIMGALFRGFAYSAADLVTAQALPLPFIFFLFLFAGFLITPGKMGWLKFLYYLNFFAYGVQSLALNEYGASRYQFIPGGVPEGDTLGDMYLKVFEFETRKAFQWGGVAFMAAQVILMGSWSIYAFNSSRFDRNVGSSRTKTATASIDDTQEVTPLSSATITRSPSNNDNTSTAIVSPLTVLSSQQATRGVANLSKSITVTSVIKFEPQWVSFKDLKYTVKLPKQLGGGSKTLLQGISGFAAPGRMLALMGASGAGKTTLLDILASRKNSGQEEGSIYLNGFLKDKATFNRVAAYCEQQDLHMSLQTVREALEFSSALRLPPSVSVEDRKAFIDQALSILELDDIQDRKVGEPGDVDGLAPGERKRLTIAVELASNAPILFLDEPTSGLDSRAAAVVMRVIKAVAATGRTVICTIHQPSAELFFMFDDLLLLQRGGYQVYFGPLGAKGRGIVDYLESLPGSPRCAASFNPAGYMLDVLSGMDSSGGSQKTGISPSPSLTNLPAVEKTSEKTPVESRTTDVIVINNGSTLSGSGFQDSYFSSDIWRNGLSATTQNLCTPKEGSTKLTFTSSMARSIFSQYFILLQRQHSSQMRNIPMNIGRLGALTFINLLFGTVWFGIAKNANDVGGVQSLISSIFMVVSVGGDMQQQVGAPTIMKSRAPFYRESASLFYDTIAYSLALVTAEIPWMALTVIVSNSMSYFMLGLSPNASVFFFHILVGLTLAGFMVSLGMFTAFLMPSFETAQALGAGVLGPIFFLFGGLFQAPSRMPPAAQWVTLIDPIYYAFSSLISTHFYCKGSDCPSLTIPLPTGTITMDRYVYIEKSYEVKYDNRWQSLGYIAIGVLFLQSLHLLSARYVRHITR